MNAQKFKIPESKWHRGRNDGGALVAILTIGVIINIALVAIYFTVNTTVKRSGTRKTKATVLNIAEAGKEHLYADIRCGAIALPADSLITPFAAYSFGDGSYTVACSTNAQIDSMWIHSSGSQHGVTTTLALVAALTPAITINFPPVRGAITARSGISVKGNINVDGRDYDSNMVLVGPGLYGVSTCGLLSVEGSSTVGGNGVAPVSNKDLEPVESVVAQQSAPFDTIFNSPESFLGLPAGSLDPYVVSTLTTPFEALVYLKESYVGPVHFGESRGILIVHNSAKTAELQITDGTFKGLIICDRMAKISGNANIIGSVVTLTDGEVSTFGTGTAEIKYSMQVLANLQQYCKNLRKNLVEVSWQEMP